MSTMPLRVPTWSIVWQALPWAVAFSAVELLLERGQAPENLQIVVGMIGSSALLVLTGYRAGMLGGSRGQATSAAWRLTLLQMGLSLIESLLGWRTVNSQLRGLPLVIKTGDEFMAMIVLVLIVLGLFLLLSWIFCWVFAGVGYWISDSEVQR